MLAKLIASALGTRLGGTTRAGRGAPGARIAGAAGAADGAADGAEAVRDFPPMRPLEPPPARNDDLLEPVHAAVERDLRARGYLR